MTLKADLQQCIADTHDFISPQAANRLKIGCSYETESELINSITKMVSNEKNFSNGFQIAAQGGMSLEKIVIKYADKFSPELVENVKKRQKNE
ncbi:hypothetical protein [Neisseria weaveri]|uniref:hypothetical protein n=1 Tax=Neisseria weaveri TaxID=28091 RepID=UPI000D3055C3|nr:hypothetical protein [Neisseria weaveri]